MTRWLSEATVIRLYQCRERSYLESARLQRHGQSSSLVFPQFYLGVESDIAHVFRKDILDSSTSAAPFNSSEPLLTRGTKAPSLDFTKSAFSQLHCKYQRLTSFEDQVTSSKTVHGKGTGIASHTRHYVEEDPGRPTVCF